MFIIFYKFLKCLTAYYLKIDLFCKIAKTNKSGQVEENSFNNIIIFSYVIK